MTFFLGRYIRTNLNMPHSLPQRSGGFRDYEKDAPITVFGCMQARLVGKRLGVIAQPLLATSSEFWFQGVTRYFVRDSVTFLQVRHFLKGFLM